MAGKASFCFGAQVGAEAQNVRGKKRTRAKCRLRSHVPASPTVGRVYFFDLVVDFLLPPDFLDELFELDLLLLFLAMALDLLS